MIISFGWTWPAFVAGQKCCTRRNWKDSTAMSYAKAFSEGRSHDAYDKSPLYGGRKIGSLRLSVEPYKSPLSWMPDVDFRNEGFEWMSRNPHCVPNGAYKEIWCAKNPRVLKDWHEAFERWRESNLELYVVRFDVISIRPDAVRRMEKMPTF
ncbi:MAG: hypothetical protein ABFD89_09025 [Bryobacteraceae bacterium]